MSQRAKGLVIGLFILWTFFVLGSFFAVQKPFAAVNARAVGNVLLNLFTAGWLALIALGLGSWVLSWLRVDLSLGERVILGTGLGLGALGLLSLACGWLGLYQSLIAYLVTLTLSGLAAPQLWRLWQAYRRPAHFSFPPVPSTLISSSSRLPSPSSPASRLPSPPPSSSRLSSPRFASPLSTVYCLLIALFTLLVVLLPPTDWDGLFYHLTGPKLYLQAGGIVGGIDIPHLNFPSLMEMLFAWAMLLRGDIAAKLLHAVFGLLLAGLVYRTTTRFFNQKAAWPAVVLFLSMPMVSVLAGWAYNDLALAFCQLAAVYAFICWKVTSEYPIGQSEASPWDGPASTLSGTGQQISESNTDSLPSIPSVLYADETNINTSPFLILSGLFAGLAMGLKYTSFVTPLVIGGLILWHTYRLSNARFYVLRFGMTNLATFVLPAVLVAMPWYIKNWAFTGNPVYPFLFDLFGGQFWDAFRANWYAAAGTGIGWRPDTLLALPWLLTLGVRDMNFWDGRTGPLLLLFLPLVVWAGFSRRSERPAAIGSLLVYALAQFIFWTAGVIWTKSLWQSRLLLPSLVALTPVAGWVWVNLTRFDLRRFALSRFVNIAIGLTLALTLVDIGLLTLKIDPLPYLTGLESRDAYLTRRLGAYYATMQRINQTLPAEAVIVFLWEPRSYDCQRDCRPDSILDTFPHLAHQYGSAQAIAQAWRQAGVTHVLIHRQGLDFVLNESPQTIDMTILAELQNHFLHPVIDVAGAYQVYALAD